MGANAEELILYVEKVGLTPLQTIVCATRNNAIVMGLQDQIGTLEAGKQADLLVVKGDPLQDIRVLRDKANIETIYQAGKPAPRMNFGA